MLVAFPDVPPLDPGGGALIVVAGLSVTQQEELATRARPLLRGVWCLAPPTAPGAEQWWIPLLLAANAAAIWFDSSLDLPLFELGLLVRRQPPVRLVVGSPRPEWRSWLQSVLATSGAAPAVWPDLQGLLDEAGRP